ncbi:zinc finger protein 436-like isoform X2 [Cydia pomonella]|uniref:zinc finger protein 436-like isoform X2 n=1 Tax=Cydia pomonella TaxID=82600 RepID=UPI002ADE7F20|nr:zinc finger protein 436-like isoform X2 [Cydia pomonella]
METRVCVSVEVVRVKEEPQWEQDEAQAPDILTEHGYENPVCVKEEPLYSDVASLCSESAELYADHKVNDQLVLGPVVIQQPEVTEKPVCVKEEPSCIDDTSCVESGSDQQVSCGESSADQQVSTCEGGADQQVSTCEGGADQQVSTCEGGAGQQVTRLNPALMLQPEVIYALNASHQAFLRPPVPRTRKRRLQKSFSCDICNKKFKYASHMARHQTIHEKNMPARVVHKGPFYCVICCKPFSQLITFTAHLENHTTKLPYYCEICKEDFPSYSSFAKHNESHVDSYGCELCEERFVRKIELLRHRLNHTVSENYLNNKPKRINILRR